MGRVLVPGPRPWFLAFLNATVLTAVDIFPLLLTLCSLGVSSFFFFSGWLTPISSVSTFRWSFARISHSLSRMELEVICTASSIVRVLWTLLIVKSRYSTFCSRRWNFENSSQICTRSVCIDSSFLFKISASFKIFKDIYFDFSCGDLVHVD